MQNAPLRAFCNNFGLIGLENDFSVFFLESLFYKGFTYYGAAINNSKQNHCLFILPEFPSSSMYTIEDFLS